MNVIINRIHFGNFRFILELEAGPEIEGPAQITLWVAEKIDVQTIPLHEFTLEQLLYSVKEPLRSQLHLQLETEKQRLQHSFTEKIAASLSKQKHSSHKTGYTTSDMHRQQEKALLHLEQTFRQNKLLFLDQNQYNLETLQAESHLFSEERFLCHFRDQEVSDDEIRHICFQFAFDPAKRAEMLAEAASQKQPMKPIFE